MDLPLKGRTIGFTAPQSYGEFLRQHLIDAGAEVVWAPTLAIRQTPETQAEVQAAIAHHLGHVAGIAFTSRNGINAIAPCLPATLPPLQRPFLLGALGRDAELLEQLGRLRALPQTQTVVPAVATPKALVKSLGRGEGRSLLCPVPQVVGLSEPEVIPQFLADLAAADWRPIRVNAYETAWLGADCAASLQTGVDAVIFSSTAEVEGLIRSFASLGLNLQDWLQRVAIASHGPVTAKGAVALGMSVNVISSDSSSFVGVVQALIQYWQP